MAKNEIAKQPDRVVVQSHTRTPPVKMTQRPNKVTVKRTATEVTTYEYKKR